MRDLIAKLEAATEPSRELDALVALVCNLKWGQRKKNWHDFTASADAAMTLLPPPGNPHWTLAIDGDARGGRGAYWRAKVTVPSHEFWGHSGVNMALAICIASLRARSAT